MSALPVAAPVTVTADDGRMPALGSNGSSATGGNPVEAAFIALLADVVGVDRVSPDSHFFDELGADSMTMTRFCARVRKHPDLPVVSMREVYRYPTAATLAAALERPACPTPSAPAGPHASVSDEPRTTSTAQYVLCGAGQALFLLGYGYLITSALTRTVAWVSDPAGAADAYLRSALVGSRAGAGYQWLVTGTDPLHLYARSVALGAVTFTVLAAFPVVVKWLLVGRWRPGEFPVWSLRYFRFWVVKTLVITSPMVLFVGTPLYLVYLRALGARIGSGAVILSPSAAVCADLLTVGPGTVICKGARFACYRAIAGRIETGPVTLGREVYVGPAAVLDIDTEIGDGSRLAHASSLQPGQRIPAGCTWHGSPGRPAEESSLPVSPMRCTAARRFGYSVLQLVTAMAGWGPLLTTAGVWFVRRVPAVAAILTPTVGMNSGPFYRMMFGISTVLFFAVTLLGYLLVRTVPRLIALMVKPGRVYPLYGLRYWALRALGRATNIQFFTQLCGDSWLIPYYLRSIGYRLPDLVQTGTNFGMNVRHDHPYLTTVGSGTVVADGLSLLNADYSASSFLLSPVSIGARNFLGNNIAYPATGRTGDDCLLATKVMVPVTGPIRTGVGLLGSPSFEIPRTVLRDSGLAVRDPDELNRWLRLKARHNLDTMSLLVVSQWLLATILTLIIGTAVQLYRPLGPGVIAFTGTVSLLLTTMYYVLLERVVRHLVRASALLICPLCE